MPGVPNFNIAPRPPAPWIEPKTGQPTPIFYQFIVNLFNFTGGGQGLTFEQAREIVLTVRAPNTSAQDRAISEQTARTLTGRSPNTSAQDRAMADEIARAVSSRAPPDYDALRRRVEALEAIVAQTPRPLVSEWQSRVSTLENAVFAGRVAKRT